MFSLNTTFFPACEKFEIPEEESNLKLFSCDATLIDDERMLDIKGIGDQVLELAPWSGGQVPKARLTMAPWADTRSMDKPKDSEDNAPSGGIKHLYGYNKHHCNKLQT